jgi:hypothetical protein
MKIFILATLNFFFVGLSMFISYDILGRSKEHTLAIGLMTATFFIILSVERLGQELKERKI